MCPRETWVDQEAFPTQDLLLNVYVAVQTFCVKYEHEAIIL